MSRFNLRADTLIRRLSDGWRTGREELFFSDPRANLDSLLRHSRERVVFDSDSLMRFFFEGDSAHVRFRARADTIEVPSAPDIPPFPRPSTRWSDEEQETLRREMQQLREEMQALQRELHEKNRAMQELQRELRSEMVHLQREELEAQVEEARRQARENREHVRESRQLVAEQLRQEGERLRAEAEALPEGDERRARLLELSNRLLERAEQIQSLLREDDSSQG